MKGNVVLSFGQTNKTLIKRFIINTLVFVICISSIIVRKDVLITSIFICLYFLLSLYEFLNYQFFTYNRVTISDTSLEIARQKRIKSVSFVDIKVIKEMRDGVKIIRRDGGMYKILGDVINPNEDNEDYLKRNILVDEIEKRSGIVIEYKRKQKDL